ncbi:MAG: two-component regulator propeller domain-containing protein [Bacteroidota bacterium]
MKKIILLFIWMMVSPFVQAQSAFTFYNTVNSPLPENSVRCITSSPNGTVWVGTDFGLAAFDGASWSVYNTLNSGLPDNSIRSLVVDGSTLWVGTFIGGLARYDGNSWTVFNTFNSDLPDDFVRSLSLDSNGKLWVGTIGGLGVYDGSVWTIYNTSNTPLLSINISALCNSATSTYVGTINGGWGIYTNGTWQHFTLANSNLPDNSCLGIVQDASGTPWLATPANGVSAYVGGIQFLTFNTLTSGIASNSTSCIAYRNASDELWIGSGDAGLIRKSNLIFNSYGTTNATLPDNVVQSVHVDAQGIVWAGMQVGGLARIDPTLLTGIDQISTSKRVSCFPNPAKERVHFELPMGIVACMVSIHCAGGKTIKSIPLMGVTGLAALDVSDLSEGVYHASIQFPNGIRSYAVFMKQD